MKEGLVMEGSFEGKEQLKRDKYGRRFYYDGEL